jgi:hypothetical protein
VLLPLDKHDESPLDATWTFCVYPTCPFASLISKMRSSPDGRSTSQVAEPPEMDERVVIQVVPT